MRVMPVPAVAPAPAGRAEAPADGDGVPAGRPGITRGHLWQVDVVRLLTFTAVIAVHSLAFTEQPDNRAAAGAMMLLQYGREVFFSLTGFVLIYSTAGRRSLQLRRFWPKRILYVAVPYVVWSGIYYAYDILGPAHASPSLSVFGTDLLYAGAKYHLYFLLVTVQLYLAFPLIRWFVLRTAHRALPVLAAVSAANLAWLAVLQYGAYPHSGPGLWVYSHAYELLPSYLMYVLGGAYAAVHLDRLQELVDARRRLLLAVAGLAAVGALVVYSVQLPFMAPRSANDVLQPGMALSCLAATIVVYLVGSRWAEGPRRRQALIETLSDASFGVYLSHPLVLQLLLDFGGFGNGQQVMPAFVCTVLALVISVAGGTAISLLFRRTPLSLPLTGRPWRAQVKRQPATAGRRRVDLQPALAAGKGAAAC